MAKDKLIIVDDRAFMCRISWWISEDQEIGGTLGEGPLDMSNETGIASQAIKETISGRDEFGFYWESKAAAKRALAVANAAIKSIERPLPDWAVKAIASGWKQPKGWKP
jgi:hypothetical protein